MPNELPSEGLQEPDNPSKADSMKTQGLFILVRLFLFLAIILAAVLIVLSLLRKEAFSGNKMRHPLIEDRFQNVNPVRNKKSLPGSRWGLSQELRGLYFSP